MLFHTCGVSLNWKAVEGSVLLDLRKLLKSIEEDALSAGSSFRLASWRY